MAKVYSFANVDLFVNGVEITELAEGEDVFRAERLKDAITHKTGAKGNMVINVSPDESGQVIIKCLQTSPLNSILEQHVQAAQKGAFYPLTFQMRDSSLNDVATGTVGYCPNLAPISRGDGVSENEWRLVFEKLYTVHGSASVDNVGSAIGGFAIGTI